MTIRLQINGESRESRDDVSVAALLQDLELTAARVAVEHNRRVLRREEFARVRLADGDRLEIVHFVGGG